MIFKYFVLVLRYNKTNCVCLTTSVSIIIENFSPSVRKMLLSIFNLEQHFTNFGSKIFSDDLDASHYLYNDTYNKNLQCGDTSTDCNDRCSHAAYDVDRQFNWTKHYQRVCTFLYAYSPTHTKSRYMQASRTSQQTESWITHKIQHEKQKAIKDFKKTHRLK